MDGRRRIPARECVGPVRPAGELAGRRSLPADGYGEDSPPVRALFLANPLVGHVLPLVPLAAAFRDAGHDVLVATGGDGAEAARRSGLTTHDIAPGVSVARVFAGATLRHPVQLIRMVRGDSGTEGVGLAFAAMTARLIDSTLALADEWLPDLVLHEGLAPVGALAAARRGVPSVLVDALIFDGRRLFAAVTSHLGGSPAATASRGSRTRRTRSSPYRRAWSASGRAGRCAT